MANTNTEIMRNGKITNVGKELLYSEYEKEGAWGDINHHVNTTSSAVDFGDFLWVFDKPRIEKSFWKSWGHAGMYSDHFQCYESWNKTDKEQYFIDENLQDSKILDAIELLESDCPVVLWNTQMSPKSRLAHIHRYDEYDNHPLAAVMRHNIDEAMKVGHARFINDIERQLLLEAMKIEKEKFEKRLRTYLKKYGTSKLRFDTYWADR